MALRVSIPILLGCAPTSGPQGRALRSADSGDTADTASSEIVSRLVEVQDAIAEVETANTATTTVQELIQQMKLEALEAASDTRTDDLREDNQYAYEAYEAEVDRLAVTTTYDGTVLTDGSTTLLEYQFTDDTASPPIQVQLCDLQPNVLGVDTGSVNLEYASAARSAIDSLDSALDEVADCRGHYRGKLVVLEGERDHLLDLLGTPDTGAPWDTGEDLRYTDDAEHAELLQLLENVQDGLEIVALLDNAMVTVQDALAEMHALAEASDQDGLSASDRTLLQDGFAEYADLIDTISANTEYERIALADGSSTVLDVQVSNCNASTCRYPLNLSDLRASTLGVDTGSVGVSTRKLASSSTYMLEDSQDHVAGLQVRLAEQQSVLESYETAIQTLLAAE